MQAQTTTTVEDVQAETIIAAALIAAYEAGKAGKPIESLPSEYIIWQKLTAIIGVEI